MTSYLRKSGENSDKLYMKICKYLLVSHGQTACFSFDMVFPPPYQKKNKRSGHARLSIYRVAQYNVGFFLKTRGYSTPCHHPQH